MATAPATSIDADDPTRLYTGAVERMLGLQPRAGPLLRRAVAVDPGFAPAHAGLALLHHRAGRTTAAYRRLERAAGAAAGATRRERSHVAALAGAITGDYGRAWCRLRSHLADFPRDPLLLQEAAEVMTWSGQRRPWPASAAATPSGPSSAPPWQRRGDGRAAAPRAPAVARTPFTTST